MAVGTDKELFKGELRIRTKSKGRPRVNRVMLKQALKAGYSTHHIARVILKCTPKTVRRIKQEMIESGELHEETATIELDKVSLVFDDECVRAVGISFFEWLKAKTSAHKYLFRYCEKIWAQVWGKPSLVLVKDSSNPLGDQICMKFLEVFGDDVKRVRRRKKQIRYIFRFLGRSDLCDRYLTMTKSRDPESIREIPELSMLDFPIRLDKALNKVRDRVGQEAYEALRFKIATLIRTGAGERELFGITVGTPNGSYMLFTDEDHFRGQIIGKGREKWTIEWLPREVRHGVYQIYKSKKRGEHLFDWGYSMTRRVRDEFARACEEVGLPPLIFHDLRKVGITWLWAFGIDLAIATEINVGWKDLNTAKKHYLHMAELLRKDGRRKYRDNIPAWFKDGLDEYLPFSIEDYLKSLPAETRRSLLEGVSA